MEEEAFVIEPLGMVREAIAKNMAISHKCIPVVSSGVRVDFRDMLQLRESAPIWFFGPKIGREAATKYLRPEVLVIEGVMRALEGKFRALNSCYGCGCDDLGPKGIETGHFKFEGVKTFRDVNLGVSYHLGVRDDPETPLLVPVLHRMNGASYREIADRYSALREKMEKKDARAADFRNCTFTFNNAGVLGTDDGKSIVSHGQSAICSLSRIETDPVSPLYGFAMLSLAFDHRVHSGAYAASFLLFVKRFVEETDFKGHVLSQFA